MEKKKNLEQFQKAMSNNFLGIPTVKPPNTGIMLFWRQKWLYFEEEAELEVNERLANSWLQNKSVLQRG